jgi:mannose-6-phosphate isomerase
MRGLQLPWLAEVAADLEGADATKALKDLTSSWLSLPPESVRAKLADVRAAALAAESRAHGAPRLRHQWRLDSGDMAREAVRVYSATVRLIDRYPGDPGVLVTMLLNHVVLAPGESIFINAGVVHAYTSGFGVEIMASSDNVLRAGLTSKHIDIPEVLEVADFSPTAPPHTTAVPIRCGVRLAPPVDEFELIVLDVRGEAVTLEKESPRIVLCLRDGIDLRAGDLHMALAQGESAFVAPSESPLTVSGHGRVSIGQTPTLVGGGDE